MSELDKLKKRVVGGRGHVIPGKVISTPHQQTPLFIKSWSRIVQIVLLSSTVLMVHFAVVILTPLKSFFLLSIWTVIRLLLV
jgi:hypothetical protein